MGCRTRDCQSTLRKSCLVEFRFHPDSTADASTIPVVGGYGSTDIDAVEYQDVGNWKVTLHGRHTRAITSYANYHTTTAPGTMTAAMVYNIADSAEVENTFYVQLWIDSAASSPVYSASNYVHGFVEYEEIAGD